MIIRKKFIFLLIFIQAFIFLTYQLYSQDLSLKHLKPFGFLGFNFTYDRNIFTKNDNSTCYIPILDIWHANIKTLLKTIPVYNKCKTHTPFTYITNEAIIKFNQTVNSTYYNGSIKFCQLAIVLRKTIERDEYILSEYRNITDNVPLNDDFVKVRCFTGSEITYEYVHSVLYLHEKYKKLERILFV